MKYILVIGDGMADNPLAQLGGKTPLQYASIPFINSLAARGEVGRVKNCPQGLPPGSDTAILSIFGADPRKCYTGRSPLEAAATGIKLAPGDVSYRCNMVALEEGDKAFKEKKILSHSGGSVEGEQSDQLINWLFEQPEFAGLAKEAKMRVYPACSFRHIAVQEGADNEGIRLIPPHDHLGEVIGEHLPSGCENAQVLTRLMEAAHKLLDGHPINEQRRSQGKLPANGIWFWAEGTGVALESFEAKYGKKGAVISAVPLCHGIARLSGLEAVEVEGATGELDTNLEGKVAAALELLDKGMDFVAVHVEAPDECTHNGDLEGKLQAIEWLDSRVIKPLAEGMESRDDDYRLLFISDHKTLTSTRGHDGDPVPYLIFDSRRDSGQGFAYCEADGDRGPDLGEGIKLMARLFEQD